MTEEQIITAWRQSLMDMVVQLVKFQKALETASTDAAFMSAYNEFYQHCGDALDGLQVQGHTLDALREAVAARDPEYWERLENLWDELDTEGRLALLSEARAMCAANANGAQGG